MNTLKKISIFTSLLFLTSCTMFSSQPAPTTPQKDLSSYKTAVFAGGCFWCIETAYEGQEGVAEAISGYIGGTSENATYKKVSTGTTKHYEAVEVYYDPQKISYKELVEVLWNFTDPTDDGGQFVDRGPQYRTAIFYKTDEEKQIAEDSIKELEQSKRFPEPIVTKVLAETTFYPAEEYHQDYAKKQSGNYNRYKNNSGRNEFFEKY